MRNDSVLSVWRVATAHACHGQYLQTHNLIERPFLERMCKSHATPVQVDSRAAHTSPPPPSHRSDMYLGEIK